MFLIIGFVLGMTAGFTVLTAQKFGTGDMKAMHHHMKKLQKRYPEE